VETVAVLNELSSRLRFQEMPATALDSKIGRGFSEKQEETISDFSFFAGYKSDLRTSANVAKFQ
jgi:hypothetical protein